MVIEFVNFVSLIFYFFRLNFLFTQRAKILLIFLIGTTFSYKTKETDNDRGKGKIKWDFCPMIIKLNKWLRLNFVKYIYDFLVTHFF